MPYCVLEDKFRPLIVRAHGIFICDNCGHSLSPSDEYHECRCARCSEMNRISA
jgi:hypothetical protein